jgi:hypothetical protein
MIVGAGLKAGELQSAAGGGTMIGAPNVALQTSLHVGCVRLGLLSVKLLGGRQVAGLAASTPSNVGGMQQHPALTESA